MMPGLIGGGGSSTPVQQVPFNAGGTGQSGTVYTPSAQPQADTTYQALLNNLYGQYTSGTTPPQQNYPLAENAALNIAMNPFAGQQLQGAQDIRPYLQGAGNTAANQGIELQSLIPMITGLGNTLSGYMPSVAALSPQVTAGISPLQQSAANLIQTGYDPQNALFMSEEERVGQQAAGQAAQTGLGSSPYAAGLAADALGNFDIGWQNQQLARQAQALQGAGQAYGQAGRLGTEGANIYGEAGQLGGEAANLYSRAPQIASSLLGLGTQGASAYMQGAGLPYSTSVAQSQNAIPALTAATNLGISQYQLPQQVLNDLQSYLRLGQSASDLSGVLGNLGFNQGQQQLGNLGGAIGFGNQLFGNPLGLSGGSGGGIFGSGGLFAPGVDNPITPAAAGSDFFVPGTSDLAITGAFDTIPAGGGSVGGGLLSFLTNPFNIFGV